MIIRQCRLKQTKRRISFQVINCDAFIFCFDIGSIFLYFVLFGRIFCSFLQVDFLQVFGKKAILKPFGLHFARVQSHLEELNV